MLLQKELDDYKKNSPHKFAPEDRVHLDSFKNKLAEVKRNTPSVGAGMPAFSLPDQNGKNISSADLLQSHEKLCNQKLFIVFFRGAW